MNYDTETSDLKLDSTLENSFQSFYRSLPEKLSTTIRFFDRSDFWTVHNEDAIFVANEVFKSISVIRHFGYTTKGSEYVIINRTNFGLVIKELLTIKQYRIEVYKSKSSKSHDWCLAYKASPGNLTQFEDLLYGMNEASATSGLLAIKSSKVNDKTVTGISFCDVASRKMVVCELVDDANFGGLESVVVQLRASECLVEVGGLFQDVLVRNGVTVTERKKGDFDSKDIVQDMNRLLKFPKSFQSENFSLLPEANMDVALISLSASIKYLELLADESNFGQFTLETFLMGNFVSLDGAASRALNLMPSTQDGVGSFQSLFSVLNRCRTTRGQKLLSCWIHQPLLDINQIEDRLDIVEVLVNDSELRKSLHEDVLRRVPDLISTIRKLQSKRAGLAECYRVYRVIMLLPRLLGVLESASDEDEKRRQKFMEMFCHPLKELIDDLSKFKELVEATIDLSKADENEFFIKPEFADNLRELHEEMEEIEEKLKRELNKAARDLGLEAGKTIKLESNPQLGYFFRITRKEEKCLRGNERTYRTIDAHKGGVRFRSAALETLNESYIEIKERFVDDQKVVILQVVGIANGYVEPIQLLIDLTSKIDVFVSMATSSADAPLPYVRPQFIRSVGKKEINFVEMRHPCLERQDGTNFIPNDVKLSSDDKTFQLITGPNMGGKSTYIRSAGLVILMAQMGCYVPCSSASLTMVDAVLARVGASDNQMKGVSTFMAEMLEMSSILKNATENSFMIVDELGRGTSTYDGFGLAWSMAKHIATEVKCFCLFATHFHELTSMEETVDRVGNLNMTAVISQDNLTLLYKVMPGVCDQSFGIHVAELVHFPRHVIENAGRLTAKMEESTNILVGKSKYEIGGEIDARKMEVDATQEISLADIKKFLSKVKEAYKECNDDYDLWKKIQMLKDSVGHLG